MMSKSRILIADDNQANCELLEAYLAELDCDVAIAVDGQETLEKIESFEPDLILLDIMMPKLNGFEVCKKIKEDPVRRRIMVLMVTASVTMKRFCRRWITMPAKPRARSVWCRRVAESVRNWSTILMPLSICGHC